MELGKIEKIGDLRSVWPNEAKDFTPWLAKDENLSLLCDAVGIDMTVDETESSVGSFNLDILATEINTGHKIVIENQLEYTDHDHLGKTITYAAGKNANIIIWIVKKAREEHRLAVEWLNSHTDEGIGFFLLEIELWSINQSVPAVKFNVVERPNDWAKEIKKADSITNTTKKLKLEYWTAFNEYAFEDAGYAKKFKKRKPSTDNWYSVSLGSSEYYLSFLMNTQENTLAVEFVISDNKELFRKLYQDKAVIESGAGIMFDWMELPDRKVSRISYRTNADFADRGKWPGQFDWIKGYSVKIADAFRKQL